MKFVTYRIGNDSRPGVQLDNGDVLELKAYRSLLDFIMAGPNAVEPLHDLIAGAQSGDFPEAVVPAQRIRLLAPIPRPAKNVFCVGRNYLDHVAEGHRAMGSDMKIPEVPQFFTKAPTAVVGPDADVRLDPALTRRLDYEVELAIVIGKAGRDISEERALEHVFGYTIVNDVTARDLQRRHEQWFKGKSLDTTCPMGPCIVHAGAIPDPQDLAISLTVNGETRQDSRTSHMIFKLPRIIATLSSGMTLEPGDIISTGTPHGVGFAMDPPRFLAGGDVVECRIERIGTLRNTIAEVRG